MSGENQIPLQQVFTNTVSAMLNKIGLNRQLMVDKETYRLYVHDGETKGGHAVAKVGDPTIDIRAIPFKGPDPAVGETWVMGEWPSDDDPLVKFPAYVAGANSGYELTADDIDNGTENKGVVSGDLLKRIAQVPQVPHVIAIAVSDETTPVAIGNSVVVFRVPLKMSGISVRASLSVAQSTSSILTIDMKSEGESILSTLLTIENNETTSKTAIAGPVFKSEVLSDDQEITIDIVQIGSGDATGLKLYIVGVIE